MSTIYKRLELAANIAIILVAIMIVGVVVKRFLLGSQPNQIASEEQIKLGQKLTLPGVDWTKSQQTLILVLSTKCHFCTESAPFYQLLVQERAKSGSVRLIAVLPQEVSETQRYLNEHGVSVDEIKQASPNVIGAPGTPTLLLANNAGVIMNYWLGKLSVEKEAEVLNRLREN